jgi:tetratricopeptide (TPR) repeat protein
LLTFACLATEYYPVLTSRAALSAAYDALGARTSAEAQTRAIAAAQADPFSPEPWRVLADIRLAQWLTTQSDPDWQTFLESADAFRRRSPRHHEAWYVRGNWFVVAWRKASRDEELRQAIESYRQASEWYPNRALYHAQLAWALSLAGDVEKARTEAERAHALDLQMSHREQKLNRQQIVDPQLSAGGMTMFRAESAEQTIERLRTTSAEDLP